MRSAASALVLTAVIGTLAAHRMHGQQTSDSATTVLRGSVRDVATRQPIAGASIRVGASVGSVSDEQGAFALEVSTHGPVTLHVTRLGYDSASTVVDSPTTNIVVELRRSAQVLDTVAVSTRPTSWSPKVEGFERRLARANGGTFFTRDDIERRQALVVSDLVRRAPGVHVVDSMGVRLFASARGNKITDGRRGRQSVPCIMRVGVDGRVMEWGFAADQIAPTDIYGIEVYSGPATMPREYASQIADGFCGLVMIWTR